MKSTSICKCAAALAFALAAVSMQAAAAGDLANNVARQDAAVSGAIADGKQQMKKALQAYARGDYAEAFRLFRNVSVLGEAEAHYRLGLMYAEGLGTRRSVSLAAYWLRLAARQDYPGAAEALAALQPAEISS